MKYHITLSLLVLSFLASCKGGESNMPYVYESNPNYNWGYVQFYGSYYSEYHNTNNVLSVSLFTNSLKLNDERSLIGLGQYLFLEDVFVSASDTLLPSGTYKVSDSGEPFTFSPGSNYIVDEKVYTLGTTINYYEEKSTLSTLKMITYGSFTVSQQNGKYTIVCDFVTNDSSELKGTFTGELPHYDESLKTGQIQTRIRKHFH